jgi:hypothetical protein
MGIDSSVTLLQDGHWVIIRLWVPVKDAHQKHELHKRNCLSFFDEDDGDVLSEALSKIFS